MRLRPRHYVLIALLIGVFLFNRFHHRAVPQDTTAVNLAPTAPPANTPAWRAFDAVAHLRDAPAAQFDPALDAAHKELQLAPGSVQSTSDISGCLTWLDFYRQATTHPVKDTQWRDRSARHLDSCVKYHADTTAS
jgi:hypothetical protein